ncbi:RNA helicase [Thermococcus eurythermalis]|uniref:RNA helicase n=1 Tax=Thermococcus eurythermalis TaxID=1505907 RepID=A0A097QU73_9EURY|nr:CRISPR-associated helicase Cas3' [Thermococcus eurythermalis]AIU70040.1 RNA helicase [Thermococcus eurythermalis]
MRPYEEALKRLADVKGFMPERRPLLEEAFSFLTSSPKPFLILNAPTGYGKTLLSYALALHSLNDASLFDRVIHVLPMRSIIEDVQRTAEEAFGFSRTKMMGSSGEFMHLFPLNITTADTFTWDLLKLNTKRRHLVKAGREFGYDYLTQASILTSLVVFDEAHFLLEDESMATAFSSVVEFLTSQGVPIVVMTATLSSGHVEFFEKHARKNGYEFEVLKPDENDPFIRRELQKDISMTFGNGNPLEFVEPGKRNAVIVNTVERAVELYNRALDEDTGFGKDRIVLIHGRMKPSHKQALIDRLRRLKNEEFLLIGTQAVEAGVDFSSDVMVTDRAPINSLLQRLGRLARHARDSEGQVVIMEDAPTGPYPSEKVELTVNLLKEEGIHPRVPQTYERIVNEVHGSSLVSVTKLINKSLSGKLVKFMAEPSKRAPQVLGEIERLIQQGIPIMRGFLIPLSVEGEVVLISPRKLLDLYSKGLVELKDIKFELRGISDAYRVAKSLALGEDVEVIYVGDYDRERGIP